MEKERVLQNIKSWSLYRAFRVRCLILRVMMIILELGVIEDLKNGRLIEKIIIVIKIKRKGDLRNIFQEQFCFYFIESC